MITWGPGAGTQDRVSPGDGWRWWPVVIGHWDRDVSSFEHCREAGMLGTYLRYRKPNPGKGCTPNPPSP